MTFKTLLLSLTLLAIQPFSEAEAISKNLCDDLVEKKGLSVDDRVVTDCLAVHGESTNFKNLRKKSKWESDKKASTEAEEAAKKGSIETKVFTEADLVNGVGLRTFPIFAKRYEYKVNIRTGTKIKEERITDGDLLCEQLGYQKAWKTILSAEIIGENADKQGMYFYDGIGTNKFKLYEDKDQKYTVRKYVEITCARVTKDAPKGAEALMKETTEMLITLNSEFNGSDRDDSVDVHDGARKPADKKPESVGKTPHSYEREGVAK
jgi:hypothetical protein